MVNKLELTLYKCAFLGNHLEWPQKLGNIDEEINIIWSGWNVEDLIPVIQPRTDLDALIMDVNHLEFLSDRTYKQLREAFGIVIFAGSIPSHALTAFRLEADSFILKPISVSGVSNAISNVLTRGSRGRYDNATIVAEDGFLRFPVFTPQRFS